MGVRLLLIHQNFPGQFRQLAPHLEQRGHELVAIASHQRPIALKGRVLRYQEPVSLKGVPMGSQVWHEGLERACRVARIVEQLQQEGWRPDLILAHSGWGETLGLQEVWPTVPQLIWPELGCDPSMVAMESIRLSRHRVLVVGWSSSDAMLLPVLLYLLLGVGAPYPPSG